MAETAADRRERAHPPRRPERVQSVYVFPAIVFLIAVQPVAVSLWAAPSGVLMIPLASTLVLGIWSLDRKGHWLHVGLGIGGFAVVALLLYGWLSIPALLLTAGGSVAALGVICVSLGIRWLFASPRITIESLLSAMSVYLLIGIIFGIVYIVCYAIEPSWFSGVSPHGRSAETAELVYFSIGTLTGTAYGDILPTHPVARLVTNLEAAAGQLYLAVLVAMLVSGYAAGRKGSAD